MNWDMNDLNIVPVVVTRRGWECSVAKHRFGECCAVVFDGLTSHTGPARASYETAREDITSIINDMERWVVEGVRATGLAGAN
jgi:hypothetical protein